MASLPLTEQRTLAINGETYKQIGRSAAGAVSVVASLDEASNRVVALTVSSFVTLSFDPPLVMFAIQHNADSYRSIVDGQSFGVSLLNSSQVAVAQRFATKGTDKTREFPFDRGPVLGVPLIASSLAQIECRTSEVISCGDHAIIVGAVESAEVRDQAPLLYFSRQFGSFVPLATTQG